MESKDAGLLALVIVGGLVIGWAYGSDAVVVTPNGAAPASPKDSISAHSQSGGTPGPAAAVIPPPPSRTSEGEQLDAAVHARAQSAFQSAMTEDQHAVAAAMPATTPVSTAPGSAAPASGGSWGGQSASGSGWGGQGQSSGGGWGVQAGVAPASSAPAPASAQPPSPSAVTDQQSSG